MSEDLSILLHTIQECVRTGRFAFTPHALGQHPAAEGFKPRHAVEAILNGTIIEHYEEDSRCLVCGTGTGLALSKDYISTYIHCVCRYDSIQQVVVITMYRPKSDLWQNQFTRRK